eukprot:11550619-Alexandrium_andersonii.AAC.1
MALGPASTSAAARPVLPSETSSSSRGGFMPAVAPRGVGEASSLEEMTTASRGHGHQASRLSSPSSGGGTWRWRR